MCSKLTITNPIIDILKILIFRHDCWRARVSMSLFSINTIYILMALCFKIMCLVLLATPDRYVFSFNIFLIWYCSIIDSVKKRCDDKRVHALLMAGSVKVLEFDFLPQKLFRPHLLNIYSIMIYTD